jgi:hypothetical protein
MKNIRQNTMSKTLNDKILTLTQEAQNKTEHEGNRLSGIRKGAPVRSIEQHPSNEHIRHIALT